MTKSVEQLALTLNKEEEIYRDILNLSKRKRVAIKEQKMSELEALAAEEQGLVITLFKLEEIREKVVDLVLRENNVEFVENVTQLMQFLPQDERKLISEAKDRLLVLVKNVADENRFNSKLLEEKINLVNFNIDLLTQLSSENSKYTKNAVDDQVERKNIFDVRV
ncbi:flagellar protein FlgN [Fusibacter ferrireducens]|uniref:Flagellar protein FlgN n=1 Tax=Fusibacter ferrireducens TaxID=2785058 RepID=A0ABR9ZVP4_9FIRM|nr:flagellar protein FlgN [Fusibacter ferrireducens]MBF4694508.1 flagellar protein FlgN [Fusibacter ferrireducens]